MAASKTVSKDICIRCIKFSDLKNESCHLLYAKSLYQIHLLFISRPTVKDGEQTVQFLQRLTNSSEWTLSRSPLEAVSYQRNLDRVLLINSKVLSKVLGMPPYLSLVALQKKKHKMNWVLQLSFGYYILALDVTDFIFFRFYDLYYTITAIFSRPRFNEVPRDWGNSFVISKTTILRIFRKTSKMFVMSRYSSLLTSQRPVFPDLNNFCNKRLFVSVQSWGKQNCLKLLYT